MRISASGFFGHKSPSGSRIGKIQKNNYFRNFKFMKNNVLISVPDPDWIWIQSGPWIRIRNPDPDPGARK